MARPPSKRSKTSSAEDNNVPKELPREESAQVSGLTQVETALNGMVSANSNFATLAMLTRGFGDKLESFTMPDVNYHRLNPTAIVEKKVSDLSLSEIMKITPSSLQGIFDEVARGVVVVFFKINSSSDDLFDDTSNGTQIPLSTTDYVVNVSDKSIQNGKFVMPIVSWLCYEM
jgi:hypothetical protein